jgi:hypothetical protein
VWTCFADATIITRNDAKINEEVAQWRRRHRKLGRKKSPQLVALTSIKLVGARFLHGPRRTVQARRSFHLLGQAPKVTHSVRPTVGNIKSEEYNGVEREQAIHWAGFGVVFLAFLSLSYHSVTHSAQGARKVTGRGGAGRSQPPPPVVHLFIQNELLRVMCSSSCAMRRSGFNLTVANRCLT